MKRIAIYGCGKKAKELLNVLNKEQREYEIVYFILSKKEEDTFMGYPIRNLDETRPSDFDVLIIATSLYRDEVVESIRSLYNGSEYLMKIKGLSEINEPCPYRSVQVQSLYGEKICYFYDREDKIIPGHMEITGHNWSDFMIEDFFSLVTRYTAIDIKDGFFLDIGANIGTTSIYVAKRNPQMMVIGFEPMRENYRLLRANVEINEAKNVICENIALSDSEGQCLFRYNNENSGDSHWVDERETENVERVIVKTLDGYLAEKGICACDVKMIWMDCQGFESLVLSGAKNFLRENPVPLLQEFNVCEYKNRGELEAIISSLSDAYSSFVDMNDDDKLVHGMDELNSYSNDLILSSEKYTDLFFF